jgi:predicted DNA-binding transcriptional regulator YafY
MVAEKCYPNASDISDKFGISQRQAQRDIEYMRTTLNAPLAYSASRRGYFYKRSFYLPAMISTENQSDYNTVIAGLRDFTESSAEVSVVQMQLPYTAVLEITDKITVMNLRSFIVGEERHHRYRCEFPSIELFLGIIMSTGAEIRIISPDWLREKLVDFAKQILKCNEEAE